MTIPTDRLRFPDFLIIGAMKSGTTTLAFDLQTHPGVDFPGGKEVGDLRYEDVLREPARSRYGKIFANTPSNIKVGDAHPSYGFDMGLDVPGKAHELCGEDVRLIYIMRDPIRRAISHYSHIYQQGGTTGTADTELRNHDLYVDFGLYARQIRFWLDRFKRENFLFLRFEDYVKDRKVGYEQAIDHLGLESRPELLKDEVINQAEGRRLPVFHKLLPRKFVQKSHRGLLDLVPGPLRAGLKKALTRAAPAPPRPPQEETLLYLAGRFAPDLDHLKDLLGEQAPQWDLDHTIEKLLDERAAAL